MKTGVVDPLKNTANNPNWLNNLYNSADLAQGQTILGFVKDTNAKVNDTNFGLSAIQDFSKKAWETLGIDKALAVMNFIMTTHNAMMLSRNLGQTLGEVSSSLLNAIGVKNPIDGQPIDVNQVIGTAIKDAITSAIGQEAYTNITSTFNKANRILTAAQGVVWAIRGMKDAALEASEVIGSWVAKIGNNMMIQGLLEDRTFNWMDEKPRFKNHYQGFTEKLENIDDAANSIQGLVSSGTEFIEAYNESITSTKTLFEAVDEFDTGKEEGETAEKTNSASPDITNSDLNKDENSETTG